MNGCGQLRLRMANKKKIKRSTKKSIEDFFRLEIQTDLEGSWTIERREMVFKKVI